MVNVGPLGPVERAIAVPAGLTDDDRAWLQQQAELAGAHLEHDRPGRPPADISWLRTEKVWG